jgi:hypothetical protein
MKTIPVIIAPNLDFPWLSHGFGLRDSVPPPELTTVKQIHSACVLDACGRKGEQLGEGDAIISARPGVTIGIRTADCVPILVADPETRMVACVHAGWRGTAANIIVAAVAELRSRGAEAKDLCVAIGPSIGSCCYEVGPEVARRFDRWRLSGHNGNRSSLDLPAINETQLLEAGVRKIWKSGECTYCNPGRFFSFRREKEQAGRMLSFVSRLA